MASTLWNWMGYNTTSQTHIDTSIESGCEDSNKSHVGNPEVHEMCPLLKTNSPDLTKDSKSEAETDSGVCSFTLSTEMSSPREPTVVMYSEICIRENLESTGEITDAHETKGYKAEDPVAAEEGATETMCPGKDDNAFDFPCTYNTLGDLSGMQSVNNTTHLNEMETKYINEMETRQYNRHIVFVHDTCYQESTLQQIFQDCVECDMDAADGDTCLYYPSLNPVGSSYDRAIQLFHYLKGEVCYFGARNWSAKNIDYSYDLFGAFPEWSQDHPVSFLCVGYGGNTVRELLYLLDKKKIPRFVTTPAKAEYYETSQKWITSIVCIASPLCGVYQSESLSDSFLCDSFTRYFYLKYLGVLHLVSTKIKAVDCVQKMDYYDLGVWDSLKLTTELLNSRMLNNHIFAETKIRQSLELSRLRYSRDNRHTRPPILCVGCASFVDSIAKIPIYVENASEWIENDGVVPTYSQKHFFGETLRPKDFDATSISDCAANGGFSYIEVDRLTHLDVTDFLESGLDYTEKWDKLHQLCTVILTFFKESALSREPQK